MSTNQVKLPITFWIVGVIAILWNLAGIANFGMQTFMLDSMMAAMTPEQKQLFEDSPSWMPIVFGIATIAGLVGSIGLILRKKWCVMVLLVSLIAVVIQMGYSTFFTDALEVMGQSPVFPAMVVIFSVILWYYARRSDARGYLS